MASVPSSGAMKAAVCSVTWPTRTRLPALVREVVKARQIKAGLRNDTLRQSHRCLNEYLWKKNGFFCTVLFSLLPRRNALTDRRRRLSSFDSFEVFHSDGILEQLDGYCPKRP